MADLMLALVRADGSREIVGGLGLGYEFAACLWPESLDTVFDDAAPSSPGFHVWEGKGVIRSTPDDLVVRYAGAWRRATPLDLEMMNVDQDWN